MPKLRITSGPRAGTEFPFAEAVLVGRGPLADLSLDDPLVSRRHATLRCADGECHVMDLGSDNGTFINKKPVLEPTRVRHGDTLYFGAVAAEYLEDGMESEPARAESSVRVVDAPAASHQVMMKMASESGDAAGSDRRATAESLERRVRFLNDLGKVVSQTFDEAALLSFVVDELLELVPQAERGFVMTRDVATGGLVSRAARTRSGESTEITASRTLLEEVMEKREGVLVADALVDPRFAESASIRVAGIRSAVCAPMIFQEEIYGLIQVDSSKKLFEKADVALIMGIAYHVGMSLAYAKLHTRLLERELLERDLMLARKIQRHFLPERSPDVPGYEFAVEYTPALAVGGDFFDFLDLADGRVGIAVGDVSGKGVSAALYVAKLGSEVRYHSVGQKEPGEILTRVNRALASGAREGMFITMALLVLDPKTGELLVSSAGHPLPVLRKKNGELATLGRAGDVPLGLKATATFGQHSHGIGEGDLVLLYTDGVTEARNKERELFGNPRLEDAVRRSSSGVPAVMESVLSAVKAFAGNEPPADDLTLLCFGRDSGE